MTDLLLEPLLKIRNRNRPGRRAFVRRQKGILQEPKRQVQIPRKITKPNPLLNPKVVQKQGEVLAPSGDIQSHMPELPPMAKKRLRKKRPDINPLSKPKVSKRN
jgi:hypothetical protein